MVNREVLDAKVKHSWESYLRGVNQFFRHLESQLVLGSGWIKSTLMSAEDYLVLVHDSGLESFCM